MAYKSDKPMKEEDESVHRIRITLTSRNVASLEQGKFLEILDLGIL